MTLPPGTHLGAYEILAPLGAGGMGEVYRARDTRLGRDVAIKVLPSGLSSNPEIRARFEREAKTISALNHPHICVLHDVGREGDVDFLVMELIEGETLAHRLERGPLPIDAVLKVGAEIADALDRAHRAGVIHRDLKPANIMLTRSGAKLMDFGLARSTGMAGPAGESGATVAALTQSPTIAQPLTAEGTIIGTFQYMAPEQLEGQDADERADLWALGCVLYEMATAHRAFEGRSQASLIGAILHTEPAPVSQVVPVSPPAFDRLVTACLAKDPADRVQSAHDVRLQLAWMAESAAPVSEIAPPMPLRASRRPRWTVLALVAFAAALASALVTWGTLRDRSTQPGTATPQRYVLGATDLQPQSGPVVSPDGKTIVFSVREGLSRRLYRRNLASLAMTPITGTGEGQAPFFSPDGAWIGFVTPDAIKKVPAGGGVAQMIVQEPRVNSCDWGEDGMIYFASRAGGRDGLTALARVSEVGGQAEVVSKLDAENGETEAWLPEILPGGTVLITVTGGSGSPWRIVAVRPDGSRHPVVEDALLGRYVRSGYLLYFDLDSEGVLAAPFDRTQERITGSAVPLTEPVDSSYCFDVTNDGTLVYVPMPGAGEGQEIVWLDRKGASTLAMPTRADWTQPRISPDGRRILLRKIGTNCELWMLDIERASLARIVQGTDNHDAIWSPDGRRIAFERVSAPGDMVTLTVEGAREMKTLAEGQEAGAPQSWSKGGNLLVYTRNGRGTRSDVWVLPMDGTSPPTPFVATEFNENDPSISPDGEWIAYMSDETGAAEIFLRPYPDTGNAWQVSSGGGRSPLWSRDGNELYFVSGAKMMAVPIDTKPTLRVGTPVTLFDGGFNTTRARDFDEAPDGRFVAVRSTGGTGGRGQEIRVLLNWPQQMEQTAGGAR